MLALVLLALLALGCSATSQLGANGDAGRGADGSSPPAPRTDECGNGMDDDGDGRIDDGCPCGPGETQACFGGSTRNRGVGLCSDGVQTCRTPAGTEWGDWGDHPCDGDTPPAEESCDGQDDDCDGARDEECPCADGDTRDCGVEFVVAPCRGGVQTCRDGRWTGCEGAVGPAPDVCGDGIDNDCDGTTDDLCACTPVAEVCRDGNDNDCDGEVDEAACMPDWPPDDGGVPADAGPCDSALAAPRQIAPLSTSRVTSLRPSLELTFASGAPSARIELSRSPRFDAGVVTLAATRARTRPSAPLTPGAWFWRARSVGPAGESCATTPVWELWVPHSDTPVDASWGSILDANLDGYADVLVSDSENGSLNLTTRQWLFLGGPRGLQAAPGHEWLRTATCMGPACNGVRLIPYGSVGDLDGDGFPELAFHDDEGSTTVNKVVSFAGGAPRVVATSTENWDYPFTFLGDVDHDGYGDVLAREGGLTRLRRGGPGGLGAAETFAGDLWSMTFGIGDVNGDGYADAARAREPGAVEVFHGGPAGLTSAFSTTYPAADRQYFGNLHTSGDFNGDGYVDFLAGGSGRENPLIHVFVYLGGPAGASATSRQLLVYPNGGGGPQPWFALGLGDANGDGYDDANFQTALGGSPGWFHAGSAAGLAMDGPTFDDPARGTRWLVYHAGAGDVNGDGFADSVAVLTGCDDPLLHVFFGGASGLSPTPSQSIAWPATHDCPTVGGGPRPYVAAAALSAPTH